MRRQVDLEEVGRHCMGMGWTGAGSAVTGFCGSEEMVCEICDRKFRREGDKTQVCG